MTTTSHRTSLALLALSMVLSAIILGYDGARVLQVLVLAVPAWMWLWWPGRSRVVRGLQATTAGLLGLTFIVDGAVRGFMLDAYEASPASSFVLTAAANTTAEETSEFLTMYWPSLLLWKLFVLASLAVLIAGLWSWCRQPPAPLKATGWRVAALALIVAVVVVALVNKPWRKHHPMVFWSDWVSEVSALRSQWANLGEQRYRMLMRAREQAPATTPGSPQTMVLVISESVNRGHLSLYGYARDTTPKLKALQQLESSRLGVFRHAWSTDASTVPALRNFFYFGSSNADGQHLLALASSAGYQTWWISNHDDLAIDQEHALLADRVQMLNKTPGRSSPSLDHATLPALEQALQDPAPRKFIVLHLLGAHPHYELRYPKQQALFDNAKDGVYQHMKAQGRSAWVRELRNEYDSALHYHDSVVAASLEITRKAGDKAVWMYFSDHGQEVGHQSNHAGHGVNTADGYRVPLLVWGHPVQALPAQTFMRPVRTDWLGYTVIRLLGVEWPGHRPERDVLDRPYEWIAPQLPAGVDFVS